MIMNLVVKKSKKGSQTPTKAKKVMRSYAMNLIPSCNDISQRNSLDSPPLH